MKSNRLAQEKSPYLLQHAHNPVDWYPWGQTAFDKARQEHKPIFLSVGYSTCHWCHVMERESFENEAIASVLNEHFVAVKVDREERPDIDHVYMTFVQATTGGGGWPMSVFLTPELAPFFGGTYFPPEPRYGSPGFKQVLLGIAREWREDPLAITTSAQRVVGALQSIGGGSSGKVSEKALKEGYRYFASAYDPVHGGFEGAPKFPRPVVYSFLLRSGDVAMTVTTLKKMARGGIHDALGGGFHRYSVDEAWHVPHFEKMLYDQAQILTTCAEAWQASGDGEMLDIARDVVKYVLRDMRAPEGGFYSAEDADSPRPDNPAEKSEGAFYVWEDREVLDLLPEEQYRKFATAYDVRPDGNVRHDPHGEFADKNVLQQVGDADGLEEARRVLFEARSKRPRPHLDDKVLTSWNGMMIGALAKGCEVTEEAAWIKAGEKAATFLWDHLWVEGELKRRYRDGDAGIDAVLDDYAHTVQGYLNLYEAGFDSTWLVRAVELQETQDRLFWGEDAYFDTNGRDPSVLLRGRSDYDGAEPSGNSVAALNLLRLAELVDRPSWRARAEKIVATLGGRTPAAIPNMLCAMDWMLGSVTHLVVAGNVPDLVRVIRRHFIPHRVLMKVDPQVVKWHPYLEGVSEGAVYLCEGRTCRPPVRDVAALETLLKSLPKEGSAHARGG
ncbi:MAG TPA: thioredoxin domain-containing protein [Candidatus Xenobia bacterium]|jgi:hypothetical protein